MVCGICLLLLVALKMSHGASLNQRTDINTILTSGRHEREAPVTHHALSDMASSMWHELAVGATMFSESVVNGTAYAYQMVSTKIRDGSTPKNVTNFKESIPKIEDQSNVVTNHNAHYGMALLQATGAPTTDDDVTYESVQSDTCEEMGCISWRIMKVLGVSVGGGFLTGLIIPVVFYLLLTTIGCALQGLMIILSITFCQYKKGKMIGDNCFNISQRIGTSGLQKMFSIGPVILTWLSSASLVGWLAWSSF